MSAVLDAEVRYLFIPPNQPGHFIAVTLNNASDYQANGLGLGLGLVT